MAKVKHVCTCGKQYVVNVSITELDLAHSLFTFATPESDDTMTIALNWLQQNEMIVSAAVMAATTGAAALALATMFGFSTNWAVTSSIVVLPIGALLPFAIKTMAILALDRQAPGSEPVEVESLELVAPTQAKLIRREIQVPLDANGRRICNEKDLLGFARMIRDKADSISYATGNSYGCKRAPFTKIRDWALSMAYLRWNIDGAPAQGVCVTRRGREYFISLLTQ